jgi:hypothetical protein
VRECMRITHLLQRQQQKREQYREQSPEGFHSRGNDQLSKGMY